MLFPSYLMMNKYTKEFFYVHSKLPDVTSFRVTYTSEFRRRLEKIGIGFNCLTYGQSEIIIHGFLVEGPLLRIPYSMSVNLAMLKLRGRLLISTTITLLAHGTFISINIHSTSFLRWEILLNTYSILVVHKGTDPTFTSLNCDSQLKNNHPVE